MINLIKRQGIAILKDENLNCIKEHDCYVWIVNTSRDYKKPNLYKVYTNKLNIEELKVNWFKNRRFSI